MNRIVEIASKELIVPSQLIEKALRLAHAKFRKIRIPKRAGGYRTVVQPAAELKLVHSWLNSRVLSFLPISSVATAFHRGASIVNNACRHRYGKYLVRVDLSDFFPSIRSNDLVRVIRSADVKFPKWVDDDDFVFFIRRACFDRDDRLPIGYSTSPGIANAVMAEFDRKLLQTINENPLRFGQAVLTRYADDFVFSTDKAGACKTFVDEMSREIEVTESPCIKINSKKTRYMSRLGGSTIVTGLRITQDGGVRVHANYRDHVRLLLKLFASGRLGRDEQQKLVGHLAYIEYADPILFTRLSFRYFEEVALLRGVANEKGEEAKGIH